MFFPPGGGESHDLNGLRVWMGIPVRVTSQLGWQTVLWPFEAKDSRGTFIQETPALAKFPDSHLKSSLYPMDADYYDNPVSLSAFQISRDGGRHCQGAVASSVLMHHNPMIYIPGQDDSLLRVASELHQRVPGDDRNFVGTLWIFQKGGGQMLMVPEGMHVVDWPWPLALNPGPQPRENWQADFRFISGGFVRRDGQLADSGRSPKKGR